MLWVYGHYTYLTLSVRGLTLKTVPWMEGLREYKQEEIVGVLK